MTESAARGPLRRFVNRLEVDQAVFYSLCLRGWQFLAGPVSVVLIGLFFTPETQGFYYTFASLMALQTFFELGFSIVVINVSSHEWLRLRLDEGGRIVGDADAFGPAEDERGRDGLASFSSSLFVDPVLVPDPANQPRSGSGLEAE